MANSPSTYPIEAHIMRCSPRKQLRYLQGRDESLCEVSRPRHISSDFDSSISIPRPLAEPSRNLKLPRRSSFSKNWIQLERALSVETEAMLRRTQSSVPVFDIRLSRENSGRECNIVILKGAQDEAAPARLAGSILLSATDNMGLKKLQLRLVATLRLRWSDAAHKNSQHAPLRYEKTIFEQEFTQFDFPTKQNRSNPTSKGVTPAGSFTNLTSYFQHPGSGSSGATTPSTPLQTISGGSYNLPFEFVIPGDAPETIEGHDCAQLAYFLTAHIERGRFQHNLTTKKHVRIVRTLGIDTYDYSHTVSIDNTWPGKVEYSIHIPSKSVPIGGQLEVQFRLLPLVKGLKLGRIRTEIVEYSSLTTLVGTTHNTEKTVAQQSFPSTDIQPSADNDGWVFTRVVNLPTSLSLCTQDTSINPFVKITHKFRAFISLINRDGHTSELRASLPINLFISPQVFVSASEVTSTNSGAIRQTGDETAMFDGTSPSGTSPEFSRSQTPHEGLDSADPTQAPPNYSDRVYDRLYSNVGTPLESPASPILSGTHTPLPDGSRSPASRSLADLDPTQSAQLAAGLRALQLAQQNQGQNHLHFSLPSTSGHSNHGSHHSISGLQSLGLSRNSSHSNSAIDVQALSRVPSYDHALNEQADDDPAPEYS